MIIGHWASLSLYADCKVYAVVLPSCLPGPCDNLQTKGQISKQKLKYSKEVKSDNDGSAFELNIHGIYRRNSWS